MKEAKTLSWKVKVFDCNAQKIKDYDIFKGHYKDFVKKLKKKCTTKEEFSTAMDREMQWMFWARAEYELIMELDDNERIWLTPWVGCREPEKVRIDITDDIFFYWRDFAEKHIERQIYGNKAKIDVFDQVEYEWDRFVDYVWENRKELLKG